MKSRPKLLYFILILLILGLIPFGLSLTLLPTVFAQGPGPAGIAQIEHTFARIVCVAVPIGYVGLVVVLVISGFKFLTSAGEAKAVQAAVRSATWALLGILFLAIAWLILQLVQNFTGIEVTRFTLASLPGVQGFTGSCWGPPPVAPEQPPIASEPTPQPKLSENVCRTLKQSEEPNLKDEDIKVHKIKCNNRNNHLIKKDDPNLLATIRYRENPHKIEGYEEVEPEFVYIDLEGISKDEEYRSLFIARSEPEVIEFIEKNLPPEWRIFYLIVNSTNTGYDSNTAWLPINNILTSYRTSFRESPYWLRFPKSDDPINDQSYIYGPTIYGPTIKTYASSFHHVLYKLKVLSETNADLSDISPLWYLWYAPHLKLFNQYNNQVHLLMYDCPDADYYHVFAPCDSSLGLGYLCML